MHANVGTEWVVDAFGCVAERLKSRAELEAILLRAIHELGLTVVGDGVWHVFPEPGGVTGLLLLSESHLACHTYPEHGVATFNLYCCRERPEWPWRDRLAEALGAAEVTVRRVARGALAEASTR